MHQPRGIHFESDDEQELTAVELAAREMVRGARKFKSSKVTISVQKDTRRLAASGGARTLECFGPQLDDIVAEWKKLMRQKEEYMRKEDRETFSQIDMTKSQCLHPQRP